jgi:hypothetical protein
MLRIILSITSIAMGFYILMFWGAGMHGQIRFRPHMLQDWILTFIIVFLFGIPFFVFLKKKKVK